jgi:hypothetical protein
MDEKQNQQIGNDKSNTLGDIDPTRENAIG